MTPLRVSAALSTSGRAYRAPPGRSATRLPVQPWAGRPDSLGR